MNERRRFGREMFYEWKPWHKRTLERKNAWVKVHSWTLWLCECEILRVGKVDLIDKFFMSQIQQLYLILRLDSLNYDHIYTISKTISLSLFSCTITSLKFGIDDVPDPDYNSYPCISIQHILERKADDSFIVMTMRKIASA